MTFAATFREVVTPDLRRICEREAVPVAWELKDFSEAHALVMREATRRGATLLSESLWFELDWWISRTILAEIQKHIPAVQAQADASERVRVDLRRWEIELERRGFGQDLVSGFCDGALAALG